MPPTHRPGHHPPRAWRHRVLTAHRPPGKPWPPKSTVDRGPEGTVRGALRGRWAGAPDSAGSPSAGPASTLPGEPRPTPDVSLRLPYAAADTGPQAPLHPEPPAPRAPCPASPLHREPPAPRAPCTASPLHPREPRPGSQGGAGASESPAPSSRPHTAPGRLLHPPLQASPAGRGHSAHGNLPRGGLRPGAAQDGQLACSTVLSQMPTRAEDAQL